MRVLVTGASGHVGGAIARALLGFGHEVVGLSRRPSGIPGVVDTVLDLAGPPASAERIAPFDAVVHAAACLAKDPLDPEVLAVNAEGTRWLLDLAVARAAHMFLYISGVPVIGPPQRLPIDEDHPAVPSTAYHASKLFGEHLTRIASADHFPSCSLRLTAPVGPGMPDGRILSHFVRRAMEDLPLELAGEGSRRQDYVDVRDVGRAVEAALTREATGVINVARGEATSNIELAEAVIDVLGSRSRVELTGRPDAEEGVAWEVDVSRASNLLGYTPEVPLEKTITAVAADRGWHRDERERP